MYIISLKPKKMNKKNNSRRNFIKKTSVIPGLIILPRHVLGGKGFKAPSDKLNIAGVGVRKYGMGSGNLRACSEENIVALCDVDFTQSASTFKKYPKAKDIYVIQGIFKR